jgi:RNA polymerase sigma factor (sigma-70 family)
MTAEIPLPASGFRTTRWSVVLAGGHAVPEVRRRALEDLARAYWYPLYAFARRRGLSADDAADATQGLFARLIERGDLERLRPEGGRFRAWLLVAFRHYLANLRASARAARRGGGRQAFSLDAGEAESRFRNESIEEETPEHVFERAWVAELLHETLGRLRAEQERIGREALFDHLRPALTADPDAPRLAEVAARVAMTENAVKVALHRLRRRFGELLREEVAATVETPEEVDEELRALFRSSEAR